MIPLSLAIAAVSKKSEVAVQLIRNALNCGIKADYVLMDTWLTNELMIKAVLKEGLDVIGMLKQLKQFYIYKGRYCRLEELRTLFPENSASDFLGSVIVETKNGVIVKLAFMEIAGASRFSLRPQNHS